METVLTVILWTFGGAFIALVGWAIGSSDEYSHREIHNDSKPGSYYYESQKKGR